MQRSQRYSVQGCDGWEQQCTCETGVPDPRILPSDQASGDEHIEQYPRTCAILTRDWPGADNGDSRSGC